MKTLSPLLQGSDKTDFSIPVLQTDTVHDPLYEEEFECYFTKDKEKTWQYIEVREDIFDSGFKKYKGAFMRRGADCFDNPSHSNTHIVVALYKKRCVGGARVVIKEPRSSMFLPGLENDQFQLIDQLPDLDIQNARCAELSRLAVLPDYTHYSIDICDEIYKKSVSLGVNYLMWMGDAKRTRAYKRICMRYKSESTVRYEVDVPPEFQSDPNIKKYLTVLDLSKEYEALDKLNLGGFQEGHDGMMKSHVR